MDHNNPFYKVGISRVQERKQGSLEKWTHPNLLYLGPKQSAEDDDVPGDIYCALTQFAGLILWAKSSSHHLGSMKS